MLKGQYQLAKKYVNEEVDSCDELEPGTDESGFVSQKLPPSNINVVNPSRFQGPLTDLQATQKDRTNSPLKEKHFNTFNTTSNIQQNKQKPQINDQETETIKKLLYMSPKEAAQEYMALTNKPQGSGVPQMPVKGSKASTSEAKSYSHSFNPSSTTNKENIRRDDENSYPQGAPEISAYTELAAKIYNQKFHNTNPQLRQTHVAVPAHDNLLLSANEAQRLEDKRYLASKETQDDVVERLIKQGELMSENTRQLTKEYLSKELQECTFAPRILTGGPRRNFNQFLEDQKQFQAQMEMKKKKKQEQAMAEKLKENAPYKPAICQKSAKMVEKKKQQAKAPAHERLYSLGKAQSTKNMQDDFHMTDSSQFIGAIGVKGKESQPKFTPNIQKKSKNLKREGKVENLLYEDALRRQHKIIEASKMKSRSMSMTTTTMSSTSKRALAMRFIKEFDIAILEYLEMGKEPKMNYLKLNDLLRKLCFMKEPENMENPHFTPERLMLYDMWYLLRGDKYNGIHRRNLLVFLLALLKLHFPITRIQPHNNEGEQEDEPQQRDPEEEGNPLLDENGNPVLPEEEGQGPRERKMIGLFDEDGNYELTESEVGRLHKAFELFYLNRLCSADNLGQLVSTRSQQEFSYKPEINEISRNMAQNYRERMLEGTAELIQQNKIPAPKDGKITHADLLIVSKKVMEEKVNKYGELLKEEEVRDCTFHPQTVQYNHSSLNSSVIRPGIETTSGRNTQSKRQNLMTSESLGRDRVFELYSLAKPSILKKDKDAVEADFEKNADECTFQPNIGHTRESKVYAAEPTELFAKGIEKSIDRMRTARIEKEQLNRFNQRGFTTGQESSFKFAIEKGKFKKDNTGGTLERVPTSSKMSRRDSKLSQYQGTYGYEHGHGQHYEGEEGEEQYGYEQQEQEEYEAQHPYGIEQEQGLREVQEDENEGENADEQQYEEEEQDRYEHEQEQEHEQEHEQQYEEEEEEQPHFERDEDQRDENDRVPLLFVDVNLGQGRTERIVVYEGDRSEDLAHQFSHEHGLDPSMKGKLKELLDSQIASLLSRIDEEMNSALSETERQQHSEQYMHDQIQEEDDYVEDGSYGDH